MRILHVARQFLPARGGIERVVHQLALEQIEAGHTVAVLTLNRLFNNSAQDAELQEEAAALSAAEVLDGVQIFRIAYVGSSRYAIAPAALRYLASYDVIHLHSTDFLLNYLASTKWFHRKPLVLTSHGLFFHTEFAQKAKQAYFHTVMRWNLRSTDAVICVSEPDRQLLAQVTTGDKIHLIPNGIPWARLAALPTAGRDGNLLLAVGALTSRKRYDRMLTTFAYVSQRQSRARLVIIGADHGILDGLMAQTVQLKIKDRVDFLGQVDEATLQRYLGQAALFLSASDYEAFGIAAVEAAVAGCTPIMQPLTAYRSLFSARECTPLFVDYSDSERAAERILQMLRMGEVERIELNRKLREHFYPFAWPAVAEQTELVYRAVAKQGSTMIETGQES